MTRNLRLPFLLFAVFSCLANQRICRGEVHYAQRNLCSVLEAGPHNKEAYLAIEADVFADGMHIAMLTDPNCPGTGLRLGVPLPNADHDSLASLQSAIRSHGSPGTSGRRVHGTFFGKLRINGSTGKLSFALSSVENLTSQTE
jgi:hypothetical protein